MLSSLAKDNTPEGHSSDEFSKLCSQYIDFPSRGLSNSYSTCFLNVILQCLVHTRPLLAYLLKDTWEECKMEGLCWCFLCGLRRHIHSFTSHVATCPLPFFPQDIISHLQMIAPQFELGIQQDASEFMNLAIDKLQSHFLPNNNGEKGGDVENPGADIIKLMFGGVECSVITCDAQHVSSTPNAMEILELQIKDPAKSLEDCLHMYTEQETLEEPYDCPKCKAKVRAQKQILFEEIPNILVITLKRFQGLQKMEKHIASPMVLDMAPFMFSTNENENENNIYDLYAAVIHEGPTISGGHYTCYVKNYQERWLLFNDAEVSYVQGKVQIGKAYMLLYIRRTVSPQPPSLVEESKEEEQDDAQSTGCESSQSIDDIEETEQIRSHFLKKRCINENLSADQMKRLSQYWIAEDTDKEVVVQRIRKALEYYKENGHFLLPSCGKNSTIYDEELKQLYMVNKGLYKTRSLVKERRMIHVMMLVASNLSKDYFLDQRAVYYLNKEVYHLKSELLDDIVVTLCRMLQCTRASLHLSVSASGSIKGPIIIYISGGIVIDVSKSGSSGSNIPDEALQIEDIVFRGKVRFVLVVEKHTIYKRLSDLGFHRRHKCILVTGSGQADLATRYLLWMLRNRYDLRVYCLVDANPAGVHILCTYRFGSENRAFENVKLTVHDLEWIGVTPSDLMLLTGHSALNQEDYSKLEKLLRLRHVQRLWGVKLVQMVYFGRKGDIELILEQCGIEKYLSEKIPEISKKKVK